MSRFKRVVLESVDQLRTAETSWDDLWQRSDVALPTARAAIVAQWLEQFSRRAKFRALVVTDQDRWVAALPLVSCRVGVLVPAGGLPSNPWLPCGELLLDSQTETDAVFDVLMSMAAELSWQLLWLNNTTYESSHWQAFLAACRRVAITVACHEHYRSGRVLIDQTWDIYRKRLSRGHRQLLSRALRRLMCEGDVQFEMHSRLPVERVEPWLREAFLLEDRSWKGAAGTSVLRTPGMFEFFLRHSRQLSGWGQLETAALRLDGEMIAFVHGFRAKGVYFVHKVSYDPRFAAFSPGQLLYHHIFEQLHGEGGVRAVDFMGPLSQATSRWRPESYGVGRVVLSPRHILGNAMMYAYQHVWRPLRDLKSAPAFPNLGATDSQTFDPADA